MRKIYLVKRCFKLFFAALLACVCFLAPTVAFAQQQVSGTVKDATGKALPGASVGVKGSNQTTSTDAAGNFRITVPSANSTLIISYVNAATSLQHTSFCSGWFAFR